MNFAEFQHYKDRNPPWIKLHNSTLEDYDFSCLDDASKGHLMCIWLLASRTKNDMPYDPAWISGRIGANSEVNLEELREAGFIEIIGGDVPPRTDDKTQSTSETEHTTKNEIVPRQKRPESQYNEAVEAWNAMAVETGLAQVQKMTPSRKEAVNARLKDAGGLDGWMAALSKIKANPFFLGEGFQGWKVSFDWFVKLKNFTNVMEDTYNRSQSLPLGGQTEASKRQRQTMRNLQEAEVAKRMGQNDMSGDVRGIENGSASR